MGRYANTAGHWQVAIAEIMKLRNNPQEQDL
jgi:hypothetical protein